MICLVKRCAIIMFIATVGSVNMLCAIQNPIMQFPREMLLRKEVGNGQFIQFIRMIVDKQFVFCILDVDGRPEFFSTSLQYGSGEFVSISMCTPRASVLMNNLTQNGTTSLCNSDAVPSFYLNIHDMDVFNCPPTNQDCFCMVYENTKHIYDSGVPLGTLGLVERWNMFYQIFTFCLALQTKNVETVKNSFLAWKDKELFLPAAAVRMLMFNTNRITTLYVSPQVMISEVITIKGKKS